MLFKFTKVTSKKGLKILLSLLIAVSSSYSLMAQLVGGSTYPINGTNNPPTTFGTVAQAFTYLNANGVSGSGTITLEISAGYTGETGAIPALTAFTGMSPVRPIILKPAAGQTPTISTAPAANAAVIRLNGVSWFTIDGSNNGTNSQDLTITTTSTTTTVRLVDLIPTATNPTKLNVIRNVRLRGNSSTTAINTLYGIYLGLGTGTGAALAGNNDSNLFQNNLIEAVRNGIYLRGTNNSTMDRFNRVINNTIGGTVGPNSGSPITFIGGVSATDGTFGIFYNSQSNGIISNNLIRNNVQANYYFRGIGVESLSATGSGNNNILIEKNRIHNIIYNGTGGYGMNGIRIELNSANTPSSIRVQNNMLWNLSSDGDNANSTFNYGLIAIAITHNGTGSITNAGVSIYYNSVNLYDNGVNKLGSNWANPVSAAVGVDQFISGGLLIRNNNFRNALPNNRTDANQYILFSRNANALIATNSTVSHNNLISQNPGQGNSGIAFIANTRYATLLNLVPFGAAANSISVNPEFTSNTNLNIPPNTATLLESAGVNISGITRDFNDSIRAGNAGYNMTPAGTAPDLGADEFAGVSPPDLTVSQLLSPSGASCYQPSRTLQIQVSNPGLAINSGETIYVAYNVNGGTFEYDTIVLSSTLIKGATFNHTFNTPANLTNIYAANFNFVVKYSGDLIPTNDTLKSNYENALCTEVNASNSYFEDFETSNGGYAVGGNGGWTWGTPSKTTINTAGSGVKAWVTRDTVGIYLNNENNILTSIPFDFSQGCDPKLSFQMRINVEANWDALIMEGTTDGINWSQITTIDPPGNATNASGPLGNLLRYSGNNQNWTTYNANLAAFANESYFRFRFVFRSDGSGIVQGVAIDSIVVIPFTLLDKPANIVTNIPNDTAFLKVNYDLISNFDANPSLIYRWYVNDSLVSSNRTTSISRLSTDSFVVKHVVGTCGDQDSISKTFYAKTPTGLPTIDFIADKNLVDAGENVRITSVSGNGTFKNTWSISPLTGYDYTSQSTVPTYAFVGGSNDTTNIINLNFLLGGKYDVCLVSENYNGSDTLCKQVYIEVIDGFSVCTWPSVFYPNGRIYDSGLKGANYANNENCVSQIIANCIDSIYFNLSEMEIESGDFLRIYDGEITGQPLWDIVNFPQGLTGSLNNLTQAQRSFVATSGIATIQFVSNGTGVNRGFALDYRSTQATLIPQPSALVPDTICVDQTFTIFNNSNTQSFTEYYWDVDGDLVDDFFTDDITLSYATPGVYNVRLFASNCVGSDDTTFQIVVITPSNPNINDFSVDQTRPSVGEDVYFTNLTQGCSETIRWYITPNTFNFVNGTNSGSENPIVRFNATGCYDVTLVTENAAGKDSITRTCYIEVKDLCLAQVQNTSSDIGISNVSIGTINNNSNAGVAYTNYFNSISTFIDKKASVNFSISRPTNFNNVSRGIWIDLNRDGDFSDADELVAQEVNSSALTWNGSFTISDLVGNGITRMRVGVIPGSQSLTACGIILFGEFEDYKVIIRNDNTKPVITLIDSNIINIELGNAYNEPGATAFDNVDGDISANIQISGNVNTLQVGTYVISYNVADSAGNNAETVTRTVNVTNDVTGPQIQIVGNNPDQLHVFDTYFDSGVIVTDIVDGIITTGINVIDSINNQVLGTYSITYEVTDAAGNTSRAVRLVTVFDSIAPVISGLNASIEHPVGTSFVLPTPIITDNYDQAPTFSISNGSVDENLIGTYYLTYTAVDQSNNSSDFILEVLVTDRVKPSVTIFGNDTVIVDVFGTYDEAGALVSDNYDPNAALSIIGQIDFTQLGDYELGYFATDLSGNIGDTVYRLIRVVDRVAPTIEVHAPIYVLTNSNVPSFADSISLNDNYYSASELLAGLVINQNINIGIPGIYPISYQVTDPSGNTSGTYQGILVVQAGLSTNNAGSLGISVYPNPSASGIFNIKVSGNDLNASSIKVYDAVGKEVKNFKSTQIIAGAENTLDLSNLAVGTYYLRIDQGNDFQIIKLVINR